MATDHEPRKVYETQLIAWTLESDGAGSWAVFVRVGGASAERMSAWLPRDAVLPAFKRKLLKDAP